jgi:hypothetical protein
LKIFKLIFKNFQVQSRFKNFQHKKLKTLAAGRLKSSREKTQKKKGKRKKSRKKENEK